MILIIRVFHILLVLVLVGCLNKSPKESNTRTQREISNTTAKNALDSLQNLENQAAALDYSTLGQLISTITFELRTSDTENFPDGIIPYIRIDSPQLELQSLIAKDEIVISEPRLWVIIDYPVTFLYEFELNSKKGFTRAQLIKEISKHYYALYEEEEKTATVKTLPMDQRKMYNRNTTNGKYGIWGHDIADLVLTEINLYKSTKGELILILGVDS